MKQAAISKAFRASALALSLAMAPLSVPAFAQSNTTQNNQPNVDTTPLQETKGVPDNFGWLGLIGILGLANLVRKRRESTRDEANVRTNVKSTETLTSPESTELNYYDLARRQEAGQSDRAGSTGRTTLDQDSDAERSSDYR